MVCPCRTWTRASAPGTLPPSQVAAADHAPLRAERINSATGFRGALSRFSPPNAETRADPGITIQSRPERSNATREIGRVPLEIGIEHPYENRRRLLERRTTRNDA